jgi:transposase
MTRRNHTREFKEQAVKLSYSSESSVQQIAHDLGISANMLHRWRREYRQAGKSSVAFPGNGHVRDEEVLKLRQALRQAELERDILKKAVTFFAQHSG